MKRITTLTIVATTLIVLSAGCSEPPPPGDCCMNQDLVLECMDEDSMWDGFSPPYGTYSPIDPGEYQPDFQIRIANMIFTVDACPGDWGTAADWDDDLEWEEEGEIQ